MQLFLNKCPRAFIPLTLIFLFSCSWMDNERLIGIPPPDKNESVSLYSLMPSYEDPTSYVKSEMEIGGRLFYVLDQGEFVSGRAITDLLEYLSNSVTSNPESVVMCFNPRYLISYMSKGVPVELLLSFECRKISMAIDGHREFLYLDDREARSKVIEVYQSLGLRVPADP